MDMKNGHINKSFSKVENLNLKKYTAYFGDGSIPSLLITEHRTCLEICVSSSLDTPVNFKSKLLLYLCCGDGNMLLENTVGVPENLLLGLESIPGDPVTLPFAIKVGEPDPSLSMFLFAIPKGPLFVSTGSGFNELCSPIGFSLTSLSLAFSAAIKAFSLVNFISFHGLMLTWNFCFLFKREGSVSPSILIDNLGEL